MTDSSTRLALPYIQPSQAQKHVTHNEAVARLDLLVQLTVEEFDAVTPPALPTEGQAWALGAAPTDAWAGQAHQIAAFDNGVWAFVTPVAGWCAVRRGTTTQRIWTGASWQAPLPGAMDNLDGIGINTNHDATNRLAVSAAAVLLTHEGAGHQLKINKATAGDTASLLFQTGWSGRAEMGTAGADAFAIKVSADGNSWTEALSFAPATGIASGAAVQQSATDVTPGRLMRADYGYGRGNLLGTVAQAAGLPTGAVIERGTTANGAYVRFADGTQICTASRSAAYAAATHCAAAWTFPMGFAAAPVVQITADGASWATTVTSGLARGDAVAVLGTTSATVASAEIWARSGVSFGATDAVTLHLTATGRWF
ncbi:MAG: DUF2793 domain-containing protein [Sphingomonadales bacterium]|nr:DUF2793 domain-containing protein [Sphingomonadales bacterium]